MKKKVTRKTARSQAKSEGVEATKPVFPYTTTISVLRSVLNDIPDKPAPTKFDMNLLKAWGHKDNNAQSVLRVIKSVGLLQSDGTPSEGYKKYMDKESGGTWLAGRLREVYKPVFESSHTPQNEPNDKLKNVFNIHSGGSEGTIDLQVHTFKTLADFANFTDVAVGTGDLSGGQGGSNSGQGRSGGNQQDGQLGVNINLHIHLPEGKSSRDYEAIIQDIARYIYQRDI